MSPRLIATAVVAVALCLGATAARGTEITFTVPGTVTSVTNAGIFPFPDMAVGDHFSVTASYNDSFCSPIPCTPNLGNFVPDAVSISHGSVTYNVPIGSPANLVVSNDVALSSGGVGDEILIQIGAKVPTVDFNFRLVGNTQPLTSPTVPVSEPASLPGWDPSLSNMSFSIQQNPPPPLGVGTFTGSLDVAVPEPGTLGLVGLCLGLLVCGRACCGTCRDHYAMRRGTATTLEAGRKEEAP
jgi:hypothetical protein